MASDGCQVKFLSNSSPDTFVAADVLFSASIWVTPWKIIVTYLEESSTNISQVVILSY